MPISYNPGISYRGDQYTAQMFQNLSGDIQQFAQQQRIEKAKRDAQAYQNTKNQAMLDSIRGQTDSQGNPLISPEEMLKIHEAKTPEQAGALLEAGLGNAAFKIAQDKQRQQQPGIRYLQPPPGAPPGTSGRTILTGQHVQDITPFQPTQVSVPPPANNPGGPAIGGVMTSQGQFQPLPNKPIPGNANKTILMPNGQYVTYGPTGEPHPLASTDSEFKSLSEARTKAEQGVLDNSAQYGLDLKDVGQIVQNPNDIQYIAASDKTAPDKQGRSLPITRPYKDPQTGAISQIPVKPGEALSSEDAGALVQTYGAGSVRATGKIGDKQFNLPFPTLLAATNRYKSLPPTPMRRSAGTNEPLVSMTSPSGIPGWVPQSKVKDALAIGYTEQ